METQVLGEPNALVNDLSVEKEVTECKVTIIVAVHNFEDSLREMYASLKNAIESLEGSAEILFIDDASDDNTWNVLQEVAEKDSNMKAIRLRSGSGDAAVFDAGLKHSCGENIVFMNSRKRHNPAGIEKLIRQLDKEGVDLVMGWRRRADSRLNQVISKIFNWVVRKFYGLKIHDINSGIFAAKRAIFDEVPIYGDMNIFLPVLAERKGYKVKEAKIEQLAGTFRQSMFISEYIQRLLDVITVVFLINYSKRPLHFLGFLGFIFTATGAAMNLYLFFYRILGIGPIAGRPLLLLGALFLVIGIQMISIGLIGEIVIFTHARDLKEYSIEEILE
ncbi:MAG: glycosyltransferase [Bacteroidetes bacterium]|nr:MAG: glycosyltransferase [Bacteroidota bacterium]